MTTHYVVQLTVAVEDEAVLDLHQHDTIRGLLWEIIENDLSGEVDEDIGEVCSTWIGKEVPSLWQEVP